MTRTFIAVDIPEQLREELAQIQKPLQESPAARLRSVDAQQLHVTLAFLGELDDEQLQEVREQLSGVDVDAFETRIDEIEIRKKRIVWASLAGGRWQELHDAIHESLASYTPDHAEFKAHITLARIKQLVDVQVLRAVLPDSPQSQFRVGSFALYASRLTSQGPIYERLERYDLA